MTSVNLSLPQLQTPTPVCNGCLGIRPIWKRPRHAATRIVRDGTRAAEIIDRVRSFYRKGGPDRREPVDVNALAGEVLALLRNEAGRHSIATRADFTELPKVM